MSRRPTISLLVPTHREDRPLRRALQSVAGQLLDGDEVMVVGDTLDGQLPMVESLVREFGPKFRYVAHDAGHHCYGHCQLQHGLTLAQGNYIHMSDDDDVWASDALDSFRMATVRLTEPLPFLFRFRSYVGMTFWAQQGRFERNWIGGHCLLMPNIPGKIGRFTCEYSGDFDVVESTVNLYGGPQNAIWREEIVAIARP